MLKSAFMINAISQTNIFAAVIVSYDLDAERLFSFFFLDFLEVLSVDKNLTWYIYFCCAESTTKIPLSANKPIIL